MSAERIARSWLVDISAALAEIDRLSARVAELEAAEGAEVDGAPYVVALSMDDGSAGGLWCLDSYSTVAEAAEVARQAGPSRSVYRLVPVSAGDSE